MQASQWPKHQQNRHIKAQEQIIVQKERQTTSWAKQIWVARVCTRFLGETKSRRQQDRQLNSPDTTNHQTWQIRKNSKQSWLLFVTFDTFHSCQLLQLLYLDINIVTAALEHQQLYNINSSRVSAALASHTWRVAVTAAHLSSCCLAMSLLHPGSMSTSACALIERVTGRSVLGQQCNRQSRRQ